MGGINQLGDPPRQAEQAARSKGRAYEWTKTTAHGALAKGGRGTLRVPKPRASIQPPILPDLHQGRRPNVPSDSEGTYRGMGQQHTVERRQRETGNGNTINTPLKEVSPCSLEP